MTGFLPADAFQPLHTLAMESWDVLGATVGELWDKIRRLVHFFDE
jgi:hypothetical protein